MKKLFHLGIVALIAFSVSSCTKSAGDLLSKENSTNTEKQSIGTSKPVKNPNSPISPLDLTKIYNFINQPFEMELGLDNGEAIQSGQIAVFYVTLSQVIADEYPFNATLTTTDASTGEPIETYKLISYRDVGTVDAIVPDELVGTPFMVALVYLGDQYNNRTITLSSEIEFGLFNTTAQLERAFDVIPQ